MRNTDILDSDIPGADPAAVVAQYEPLIKKVAARCISILNRSGAVDIDDLYQAGRLAILQALPQYNPAAGASFLTFVYKPVQWAIWRAVGIDANTGKLPEVLVSLDEPITADDGSETARIDTIADPDILPFDEPIIEEETRQETAQEVRAAVDRLKNERQREIIQRVYFDNQERKAAADSMGLGYSYFTAEERNARRKLRMDSRLCDIAMPYFSVSIGRFRQTFESAVEAAVIWRDEHAAAANIDTGRQWTPAQTLSYMRRLTNKHRK